MASFTIVVVVKAMKELHVHDFHVEIMILAFTSACKGKDTTGLRWPEVVRYDPFVRSARNT